MYIASPNTKTIERPESLKIKNPKTILNTLFILSTTGYIAWFSDIIRNPAIIIAMLADENKIFTLRGVIETTPGLSTLTQVSILYSALYTKIKTSTPLALPKRYNIYFNLLLIFVLLRTWAWNERLALIEFLVPAAVIYLYSFRTSRRTHFIARLIPAAGAVLVYLIFSIFEYFRSWQYYLSQENSFFAFSLKRLLKYYSSSVENGVNFLSWQHSQTYDGSMLLTSIYRLPYVGKYLASDPSKDTFQKYLSCCADNEFNLASWPLLITSDIGYFFSIIFFMIAGFFIGVAHRNFILCKPAFIYYPVMFVALLELLRQHYLHGPRFTYILLGAIAIHAMAKRSTFYQKSNSRPP